MKKISKFIWVYIAFVLQTLFLNDITILNCSPDLLFTVIAIYSISCEYPQAALLGAFAGLLNDSLQGEVFGVGILINMYFALILSLLSDKKTENSPLIVSGICLAGISSLHIVLAILKNMLGYTVPIGYLLSKILVKGISGASLALLIVWISERRKSKRKEKAETEKGAIA